MGKEKPLQIRNYHYLNSHFLGVNQNSSHFTSTVFATQKTIIFFTQRKKYSGKEKGQYVDIWMIEKRKPFPSIRVNQKILEFIVELSFILFLLFNI